MNIYNLHSKSSIDARDQKSQLATADPVCRAGGKPSTWSPPDGLVEQSKIIRVTAAITITANSTIKYR